MPTESREEKTARPQQPGLSPTRLAVETARRVLLRVDEGAYATLALGGELLRGELPTTARALCTELVYGSLRQRVRLDRALAAYAPRGLEKLDALTRTELRLAAYQLLFSHVPAHAVVNQTVETLQRRRGGGLAGFANALLRRLAQDGEPALPELPAGSEPSAAAAVDALSLHHSLPRWLVRDALKRFARPEVQAFLASLNAPAPVWLRLNTLRGSEAAARAALHAELGDELPLQPELPALPTAVRLRGGHPFGGAAYGAGWFIAQDLGAQLVSLLLLADSERGRLALPEGALLDACAGVGGKTTHLAALTGNRRELDAADQSARKLALCADHAHRLGCARVRTIAADLTDAAAPLRPQYAAVLLDAPCSGLGVLRRHPEARWRIQTTQISELAGLQRQLLAALAPRVAPGGVLVYAVCSYHDEEGMEQTADFLRAHPDFTLLPPARDSALAPYIDWAGGGVLRTWPHRHDADGFFAARFVRRA